MASQLPDYYKDDRIHLWVEDMTTRDYLDALWSAAPLNIMPAGGIAGVEAMAKAALEEQLLPERIFGLVDRDMKPDNEARWADLAWSHNVYRPAVLEIENFLLDEECIAEAPSNAAGLDAATIRQRVLDYARRRVWWMTCKRVLAEVNAIRNEPFPPDKQGNAVTCEDEAVALLEKCDWSQSTLKRLGVALTEAELRTRVRQAHSDVNAWLSGEEWRAHFSGKELFRWALGQVSSGPGVRPATERDLAAQVGALQAQKNRVPPSLAAVLASIRRRAGA